MATPDRGASTTKSKLAFTAPASNGVPSWNFTPSRRLIVHTVKSSLGAQSVASQGWATAFPSRVANGSSTDDPTSAPAGAHRSMAGFHPLESLSMPTTRVPPSTGGPSSPICSDAPAGLELELAVPFEPLAQAD